MPRAPSTASDLARLLGASERPLYVLDDQRRIVYCNAACAAWVGQPVAGLVGTHCAYHSQTAAAEVAAASELCPPPQVFLGEQASAVLSHVTADAQIVRRRADFWPLADGGAAVVAILAASDEPPAGAISTDTLLAVAAGAADESVSLHDALRRFRAQAAAHYGFDRLVGVTPISGRARAQAALAAQSAANVLIVGPRGSGKRHLAAAIHYRRAIERSAELLPLDCAVAGTDLLISTVTNWLARALALSTGAIASDVSATIPAELANLRPTLLLQNVDQAPSEVLIELARLLRAAPNGALVIATSERTFDLQVAGEAFRSDLACLLSTLVIELPALADRAADIPLLAQLFLEELNAVGGRQVAGFAVDALDRLTAYAWPGNLDELAEVVREASERATGAQITLRDLPKRIHLAADAAQHARRPQETIDLEAFLQGVEKELIDRALAQSKGNKSKAARLLGLTRPRLYRRMVQLGLETEMFKPE